MSFLTELLVYTLSAILGGAALYIGELIFMYFYNAVVAKIVKDRATEYITLMKDIVNVFEKEKKDQLYYPAMYLELAKELKEGMHVLRRITNKKNKSTCLKIQKYAALSAKMYIKEFYQEDTVDSLDVEDTIDLYKILTSKKKTESRV